MLAHILFIFGSGNLKPKPKPNHIHPLLSSWFRCLKFPRVCLYKSSICLASFWYTCRLHFVFFLLILLIYLTSWERKHGHSFLYGTSFFHSAHILSCFGFIYLFSLVEWPLLSRHGSALVWQMETSYFSSRTSLFLFLLCIHYAMLNLTSSAILSRIAYFLHSKIIYITKKWGELNFCKCCCWKSCY